MKCLDCSLSPLFVTVFFSVAHSQTISHPPIENVPSVDTPVPVVVSGCPSFDLNGLLSILAIELETLSTETATWLEENRPEVHLRCSETLLNVQVLEPATGRFTGQHLNREGEMKNDMERLVALTIVELIAARATKTQKQALLAPPAPPPPTPQAEKYPKLHLGALFAIHGGKKPFAMSVGAGLKVELAVLKSFALAIDFQFFTNSMDATNGRVRTNAFSGAAYALGRVSRALWIINPGIGVRVGALTFTGIPDDPAVTDGTKSTQPFGGPCIALLNAVKLGGKLYALVNAEVGYTLWRANALVDDRVEVSERGVWFLVGAGIGVVLI